MIYLLTTYVKQFNIVLVKKMSGMIQVRLKYQISKLLNDRIMVVESSCLSRGLKKRCVSKKYLHTFLFFTLISTKIVIIIAAVGFKYFCRLHFICF